MEALKNMNKDQLLKIDRQSCQLSSARPPHAQLLFVLRCESSERQISKLSKVASTHQKGDLQLDLKSLLDIRFMQNSNFGSIIKKSLELISITKLLLHHFRYAKLEKFFPQRVLKKNLQINILSSQ